MHGILIHQIVLDGKETGVIQVGLAGGSILLQRLDDLHLALIESFFAGFADIEVDEHLVQRGPIVRLNFGIFQASTIQIRADRVHVRRVRELHIDQRSAAEIDAPRDVVPEQHGKYARHAEDQRKGEKVPLLAEKIDVDVMKELHRFLAPIQPKDL